MIDNQSLVPINRFPADFMFQLSKEEFADLRFHFGTSSHREGRKESGVLRSQSVTSSGWGGRRAFIQLRQMLASHADLARKLETMEKKYNAQFKEVFEVIRRLMAPPEPKKRPIGFHTGDK